jgi:N,N'-diacetyllegionaminate synthase
MMIGGRPVHAEAPLFVIAEIGLNHGGSVPEALALVDAAARAGAGAVKLQSLRGTALVAPGCPAPAHVSCGSLQEFFSAFELDEAGHRAVAARARAHGVAFMSTPFDLDAVPMLERAGCDAYKIASGDITHLALIERAASTGKPLVLSTGMSELHEVAAAVRAARRAGGRQVALLHCVSAYPVPPGQENLGAIRTLSTAFGLPVGLSDHGTDPADLGTAVALGATLYEKHIVLDAGSSAIDAAVSATPGQLEAAIRQAEHVRRSMGHGRRTCGEAERGNWLASRRSLYATRSLPAGHVVTAEDLIALRPARGLCASQWERLLGARLVRPVQGGEAFEVSDVAEEGQGSHAA